MFGNPETTPGGRALKFYSSVRMDVRRIESIKQGTEIMGSRTRVKIVKNKVAPPFREAEFDIMYGLGISKEGSILDVGVNLDIINKSGAWFSYGGQRIGQGRENAKQFLRENPEVTKEIETKIRENCRQAFAKVPAHLPRMMTVQGYGPRQGIKDGPDFERRRQTMMITSVKRNKKQGQAFSIRRR